MNRILFMVVLDPVIQPGGGGRSSAGLALKNPSGPEEKADRADRHHGPVFDARDVGLAESVPEDQVGRSQIVGHSASIVEGRRRLCSGWDSRRLDNARSPDRASPRGSWSGSPPASSTAASGCAMRQDVFAGAEAVADGAAQVVLSRRVHDSPESGGKRIGVSLGGGLR